MIMKNEKCWNLMYHGVFMRQVIPPFYNGTDVYVTRQENVHYGYHNIATTRKNNDHYVYRNAVTVKQGDDHYVYPNATTVAIPKRVSNINNY